MPPLVTLKKRPQFLAVRGGVRASVPSCLIEARRRDEAALAALPAATLDINSAAPRFGFTVTKKLGNAVTRNRIRRRLKAAISSLAADHARTGYDYVVVARAAAFERPFSDVVADLTKAFAMLHNARTSARVQRPKNRPEK